MSEYNKTVNLGDKPAPTSRVAKKRNKQIEELYDESGKDANLRRIKRPAARQVDEGTFKKITWVLALVVLCFVGYFLFFNKDKDAKEPIAENWYQVKMVNDEVFYGQVQDETADPLVIENVYYDYDQMNETEEKSKNLRLIKRGQEAHGPAGTIKAIRSQVLYLEQLGENSEVLRVILDNER